MNMIVLGINIVIMFLVSCGNYLRMGTNPSTMEKVLSFVDTFLFVQLCVLAVRTDWRLL